MTKKKSGFWTFIFSLLPGAAEMYMGFMKMGVSLMGLFFGESSFFYAVFDKTLQPAEHFPKVAGSPFVKGFQRFDVLCREQGTGFLMNIRLRFFLVQ